MTEEERQLLVMVARVLRAIPGASYYIKEQLTTEREPMAHFDDGTPVPVGITATRTNGLARLDRAIAAVEALEAPACRTCEQVDRGQTGEYPCKECGLPTV